MGAHGYVVDNAMTGVEPNAGFTWSNGASTNRSYLNDGRIDRRFVVGASVASGISVIIDTFNATTYTGVAVLNSNCAVQKTDATLKVEASALSDFSADVNLVKAASTLYSATYPRNKDHVLQFTGFSRRYWRLTWTWTGTVTNFSVGEIFLFTALTTLSRRSIYGSGEGKKMWTASEQFMTGERRGLKLGGPQRMLDLQFSDLSESERDELDLMWSRADGNASPLLWVDSYEATAIAAAAAEQNCVFGRLDDDELFFQNPDFGRHQPSGFKVRSAGREAGA